MNNSRPSLSEIEKSTPKPSLEGIFQSTKQQEDATRNPIVNIPSDIGSQFLGGLEHLGGGIKKAVGAFAEKTAALPEQIAQGYQALKRGDIGTAKDFAKGMTADQRVIGGVSEAVGGAAQAYFSPWTGAISGAYKTLDQQNRQKIESGAVDALKYTADKTGLKDWWNTQNEEQKRAIIEGSTNIGQAISAYPLGMGSKAIVGMAGKSVEPIAATIAKRGIKFAGPPVENAVKNDIAEAVGKIIMRTDYSKPELASLAKRGMTQPRTISEVTGLPIPLLGKKKAPLFVGVEILKTPEQQGLINEISDLVMKEGISPTEHNILSTLTNEISSISENLLKPKLAEADKIFGPMGKRGQAFTALMNDFVPPPGHAFEPEIQKAWSIASKEFENALLGISSETGLADTSRSAWWAARKVFDSKMKNLIKNTDQANRGYREMARTHFRNQVNETIARSDGGGTYSDVMEKLAPRMNAQEAISNKIGDAGASVMDNIKGWSYYHLQSALFQAMGLGITGAAALYAPQTLYVTAPLLAYKFLTPAVRKGMLNTFKSIENTLNTVDKVSPTVASKKVERLISLFPDEETFIRRSLELPNPAEPFSNMIKVLENPKIGEAIKSKLKSGRLEGGVPGGKIIPDKLSKPVDISSVNKRPLPKESKLFQQLQKAIKSAADKKYPAFIAPGQVAEDLGIIKAEARKQVFSEGAIPTQLLQEAKKYNSAGEFVKTQTNQYHGSPYTFDKPIIQGNDIGVHFGTIEQADQALRNKQASLLTSGKEELFNAGKVEGYHIPKLNYLRVNDIRDFNNISKVANELKRIGVVDTKTAKIAISNSNMSLLRSALEKKGYDGLIYKNSFESKMGAKGDSVLVFNPEKTQTKSQLIDIWNRAHNK